MLVKKKGCEAVGGNKEEEKTDGIKMMLFMLFLFAAELMLSRYSSVKIYGMLEKRHMLPLFVHAQAYERMAKRRPLEGKKRRGK